MLNLLRNQLLNAILQKGIDQPTKNLAGMIGGDLRHRIRFKGVYYDLADPHERMLYEIHREQVAQAEWLKNNRGGWSCFGDTYSEVD